MADTCEHRYVIVEWQSTQNSVSVTQCCEVCQAEIEVTASGDFDAADGVAAGIVRMVATHIADMYADA